MDGAGGDGHGMSLRLKCDGSEGLLVLGEVLAQHVPEGLGLLRAEVNAVAVFDRDLMRSVLMRDAEVEEEVPNAGAHLNAVGVGFAVLGRFIDVDLGLVGCRHGCLSGYCNGAVNKAGAKGGT